MLGKRMYTKALAILVLCGLIYTGFLQYQIQKHSKELPISQADYLIILGARVKGDVPSLALQYRIDQAAKYLEENKETIAIASGGQGPGENITEAASIKDELMKKGIESSRILLEDKSTDTYENLKFSKKLIPDGAKKGLVVTNDFHVYRAEMIAADEGLTVNGLPAGTPVQAIVKSYSREYLALTKYFMKSFF